MSPVIVIWSILEIAVFVAERLAAVRYAARAAICFGATLSAAIAVGAVSARRGWPTTWTLFAVCLLLIGQFTTAILLIGLPLNTGAVEHGHFTVYFGFFLGIFLNGVTSFPAALITRAALVNHAKHAS